jgi:hypothetical protein
MPCERIMYVCSQCVESGNHEWCGRYDPKELAVLPDGKWVCDGCYDDYSHSDLDLTEDQSKPAFDSWPRPPVYVPQAA